MLALKGRRTERVEAFGREFPGAAGKAEAAAAAVGDFLHRAPIIGPLALPQLAQAADLAHRDLRLVELRVERRHVGKGRDPCLDDRMQFIEILPARGGGGEARIFRSEERRVGKEGVSQCRSGWAPYE